MEEYFRELSASLFTRLAADEVLLVNYQGEASDFVRFNHALIRQSGHVQQNRLQLELISNQRQSRAQYDLTGTLQQDQEYGRLLIDSLRQQAELLPQDPYINYATQINNSVHYSDCHLPDPDEVMGCIVDAAKGLDLVGIWAGGAAHRGFANSLGQCNWHTDYSFNFDWSVYLQADKAVKQSYAGAQWQGALFQEKLEAARQALVVLQTPVKTIKPGKYRVYLTPTALCEVMGLLNWGGFGLKSHRTAQSSLLKMVRENLSLHRQVSLVENHRDGFEPGFSQAGFILPDSVSLIAEGRYQQCLCDHRSAREYEQAVNCDREQARSLEMAAGDLAVAEVFKALDTGVYISNLWYGNYSDRNNCRITGMTRFACLWLENGKPVAPLSVMRFDESVFQLLGDKLLALTAERERLMDASSYERRSHTSWHLPGALVADFEFTL